MSVVFIYIYQWHMLKHVELLCLTTRMPILESTQNAMIISHVVHIGKSTMTLIFLFLHVASASFLSESHLSFVG